MTQASPTVDQGQPKGQDTVTTITTPIVPATASF